jgi:hypothetical protein
LIKLTCITGKSNCCQVSLSSIVEKSIKNRVCRTLILIDFCLLGIS